MLIWMRNSAFAGVFKFALMGLLLAAVVGLIFMDHNGTFGGIGGIGANTVAEGAGVKVGVNDFDRSVRRILSQQGIGPQEAYQLGMISQILNAEVQNRLFTKEAQKLGLEVGDDEVRKQIAKLAEPLAADGRSKKEALQQLLRSQSISESEFVGMIRQEMGNSLLRGALSAPASLSSPLMAKSLYRYDNEKRGADVIVLKNADITDVSKPDEEQLKKYYEANKQDFLIPESRTITVATLKGDMLKKNVKISDEQLKNEYDKNIATFTKPNRRVVEQVVLQDEASAKQALDDMKAGKSPKDANTQEYEESGLLPEIAKPVFGAEKGAVLGPIKTALGYHVLKVKDTLPEQVMPFAEVKERLRDEMVNIAMTDQMYQTGNTIEDRAAGGDKLEDIVNEYGMTTETVGPFRQNGKDKDGTDLFKSYAADRDKLIQTAFDFDEGEIAPMVETADGQLHLIRVDAVVPDTYKDFASVRGDLENRWMSEQRKLANANKAKKALAALNDGKPLTDVAKDSGAQSQKISAISRKDAPPAPITPIVAAQIFGTEKGKAFSAEIENGYIVGTVTDVTLPDTKPDEKELAALEDLTGRSLGQDILGQYVASLTRDKKIKVNQPLLDQVYGRQSQDTQGQ